MQPDPPHEPQWLDLTTGPGEPAVRIDLDPATRAPDGATVTVSAATFSPGEHLLHAVAARLLAAPGSGFTGIPHLPVVDWLGDIVTALRQAGALPPLSRVPGQLAALCQNLYISAHGITEPLDRDLPEPWLSLLAADSGFRARPVRDGCAAVAVTLPELDGIALAILGLHNREGRTVMQLHASGPMCHVSYQSDELFYWPVTWIRDDGGHWHATWVLGRRLRWG
jgi:hypothetical protein